MVPVVAWWEKPPTLRVTVSLVELQTSRWVGNSKMAFFPLRHLLQQQPPVSPTQNKPV
jgi:hypothetical protein